jgi:uncharacterized protein (DUF427 family)
MGLSWQQGPLGRDPNGTFLTATPMPDRVPYLELLSRRMSVELAGSTIARSDEAVIQPARYPVAYFPVRDVDQSVLQRSDHESTRLDLGEGEWFNVLRGDGESKQRGAWDHVDPPAQAAAARETIAFAWHTMDAFYEEDFDVGDARNAARSRRAPFEEVARVVDLGSFYPANVTITIDGEKLEEAAGQDAIAHGSDRNLSVDEIGGIELVEAAARGQA